MHAYVFWMTIFKRFCSIVRNHYELTFGENQFMKAFRILVSSLLFVIIAFVAFRSNSVMEYALDTLQAGWMTSYLLPRLLVIFLSILSLVFLLPVLTFSRIGKVVISLLILTACVGGYFALNLPYVNDLYRAGEDISESNDSTVIESTLSKSTPYEGLVCLVLPNCPYCVRSIAKLERIQNRTINLGVTVFVQSKDSLGVQHFQNHVGQTDVPIFITPEPKESAQLAKGRFPTFVYVKNGKVVYRWNNSQFGYPALDWVESKLE